MKYNTETIINVVRAQMFGAEQHALQQGFLPPSVVILGQLERNLIALDHYPKSGEVETILGLTVKIDGATGIRVL